MRIEIGRRVFTGHELSSHNRLFWLVAALLAAGASINTGARSITTILIFLSAAAATLAGASYTLLWQVFHREVETTAGRVVVMRRVSWQALGLYALASPVVVCIALFGGVRNGQIQPWMGVIIVLVGWLLGAASGRFATSVIEPMLCRGRHSRTYLWVACAGSLITGFSFLVISFDAGGHFALARYALAWTFVAFVPLRLVVMYAEIRAFQRYAPRTTGIVWRALAPAALMGGSISYAATIGAPRSGR